MKKYTAIGLAFLLAMFSTSTFALADSVDNEQIEEEVMENTDGEDSGLKLETEENLTLEEAIDRALNNDISLMLLKYQMEILESQKGNTIQQREDLEDQIEDTEDKIDDLEDEIDDLQEKRSLLFSQITPETTPEQRSAIMEQNEKILAGIQQLEATIEQLEASAEQLEGSTDQFEGPLDQLESGKTSLQISQEEAREGIKMKTIASFMQILMTEEQLDLQEKSVAIKETEVDVLRLKANIGMVSQDEYDKAARDLDRQKIDVEQSKIQLKNNLEEFAIDLGIKYSEEFSLEKPKMSGLKLIEQETETVELIKNSFQYKKQLETIAGAERARDRVYDDEDSNKYQEKEADLNVQVEKKNLEQLELDLEQKVRTLYYDIEDGYQAILDAEQELEYADEDYKLLGNQYELGLVPHIDYELASIQIEQAKLTYELAKQSYFLLVKQVELLEAGFIQ